MYKLKRIYLIFQEDSLTSYRNSLFQQTDKLNDSLRIAIYESWFLFSNQKNKFFLGICMALGVEPTWEANEKNEFNLGRFRSKIENFCIAATDENNPDRAMIARLQQGKLKREYDFDLTQQKKIKLKKNYR